MSTADKLNALVQTKADIKQALIDKGQNPSDVFSTYADDIRAIETGSGSGGLFDFASIGYTGNEESIVSGLQYAKEIKDNWDSYSYQFWKPSSDLIYFPVVDFSKVPTMYRYFKGSNLQTLPYIDTSNVTNMEEAFMGCNITYLDTSRFNTSNVTTMYGMFSDCSRLKTLDVSTFDTSKVTTMYAMFRNCKFYELDISNFDGISLTNMDYMFYGCTVLKKIKLGSFDTSNVKSFNKMITSCSSLVQIDGYISLNSYSSSSMSYNYLSSYISNNLLKIAFKNIGYNSNFTKFDGSYIKNWGVNSDTVTDARQSLIDSLVTYSFDRANAGYSTCTITLGATTKALLTEDEIAQITAKGFTIT